MQAFTRDAGNRIQVVGDDFFVTSLQKLKFEAANGTCNTVLLKPNQVGTVTETLACWDAAKAAGYRAIVSARSGETEDVSIVHLAVGWGVPQLKVGSFSRSERMAKWNEALRIEEALGAKALPFPARKLFRMRVLFRFDASGALTRRVAALSADGIEVLCCPEAEDAEYDSLLPGIDVLWHVLKPVTAAHIAAARN